MKIDPGQASAVIKDVINRTHPEVEVFGVETIGPRIALDL